MGIFAGHHRAQPAVGAFPRTVVARTLGNLGEALPTGVLGTYLVGAFRDAGIQVFLHDAGIEARDDVDGLRVMWRARRVRLYAEQALSTLIVDGARRVKLVEPGRHGGMVGPIAALVAQAPEYDGGMVLVALGHAYHAVHEGIGPVGGGGQRAAQTMRLAVGLVHDVHAYGVAQLVPARTVGVVGQPDGIDVSLLHQAQVLQHQLLGHDAGAVGVVLVAVDATELDGAAVDEQLAATDGQLAEAYLLGHLFDGAPLGILEL